MLSIWTVVGCMDLEMDIEVLNIHRTVPYELTFTSFGHFAVNARFLR